MIGDISAFSIPAEALCILHEEPQTTIACAKGTESTSTSIRLVLPTLHPLIQPCIFDKNESHELARASRRACVLEGSSDDSSDQDHY